MAFTSAGRGGRASRAERHGLSPLASVGAALGCVAALSACGLSLAASPKPPPSHASAKAHHARSKAKAPAAASEPSGAPTSQSPFPPLVRAALSSLASHTALPLWGPRTLPRGNSAAVAAGPASFSVHLFSCPTPEPLDGPGVGQGECGSMASAAESFGAAAYASPGAALAQLPGPPVPGLSGYASRPMALLGNLVATRWLAAGRSGPGDTVAIRWQEGDWTIWVTDTSARVVAESVAAALQQYRLPPHPGVLVVDSAPDGQHTTIDWAVGRVVYQVSATHQAVHAIEIAASGAPAGQP